MDTQTDYAIPQFSFVAKKQGNEQYWQISALLLSLLLPCKGQ
jgi:hypothetical protein